MGESVRGTRDVADAKSALNLRPFPNRSELLEQLTGIMSPLVPAPGLLGDAPVRSVGGLGQVMHAESRYVSILSFLPDHSLITSPWGISISGERD